MTSKTTSAIAAVVMACIPAITQGQRVAVSSNLAGNAIEGSFEVGDIIPVTLSICSDSDSAVVGVNLKLTCSGNALTIRSVAFNPAFSVCLGDGEPSLPASRFHAVRGQPPHDGDRSLGAGNAPAWLATVELEVLQAARFQASLEVSARCVLAGAMPEVTSVLGVESTGHSPRSGRIDIVNARPAPRWTEQEAALAFVVRPAGGGGPVTVLAPDRTYELYYQAGYGRLNAYMLAAVAASAAQGLTGAVPPAIGDWSAPGDFGFYDVEAEQAQPQPWGGEGRFLTHLVYDFWPQTDRSAGPRGHLCSFTTGSPGELTLVLFMDWLDPTAHHVVWMRSQAAFVVREPTG